MQRPSSLILAALLTTLGCNRGTLAEPEPEGTDVPETFPPVSTDLDCDEPLPDGFGGCLSPEWLRDDLNNCTGYVACADGSINRVVVAPSDPTVPGDACGIEDTGAFEMGCTEDADCSGGAQARCVEVYDWQIDDTNCGCRTSCSTSDQCLAGQVCAPDSLNGWELAGSTCVPAACTTGADCDSGECGLGVFSDDCGGTVDLACRSAADECRVGTEFEVRTDDQGNPIETTPVCSVGPDGHFIFQFDDCDVGRPLRVDGDNRVASTIQTDGWLMALDEGPGLTRHASVLTEYWSHVGAMEHASVASFNRVSLQLMCLGAPADLIRQTQEAALDEVRHAELAFALATHFAGNAVGPGPLSLAGVTLNTSPKQVLTDLIEEACVRETLGVAEALLAASTCKDPVIHRVLEQIAADELRHSQLAWATLDWLLSAHPELRPVAQDLFDSELERAERGEFVGDSPSLPSVGLLGPQARRATHRDVVRNSLRPAVTALFAKRLVA